MEKPFAWAQAFPGLPVLSTDSGPDAGGLSVTAHTSLHTPLADFLWTTNQFTNIDTETYYYL